MSAVSNQGYPRRIDIRTPVNDTFKRFLLLKNPADDTPLPTTGKTFTFTVYQGNAVVYRFDQPGNIVLADNRVQLYKPAGEIRQVGSYTYTLRCTDAGGTYTWLTGQFVVSNSEDERAYDDDVSTINTPTLKVRIVFTLDGELTLPEENASTFDSTFDLTFL